MNRLTKVLVVASTVVVGIPSLYPDYALATVDDQRREVQRIVDELDRLHSQADILAEDFAEAADQKNQLDQDVVDAESRVASKEAELSGLRGDLSAVAVRSFTGAGADVLGPLFSNAETYSDGLRRDQYSRVALAVGTVTTDDLDTLIGDLADERANLERKRAEVENLKVRLSDKQRQTEQMTAEYDSRRGDAEARLGRLIDEEEERRSAAAYARIQADYANQQASSGGGGGGGGGQTSGGGSNTPRANIPAVSGLAGVAIQAALDQLGVMYRYATSTPGVSFDCSGLTHYAWGQAGVSLPRNSRAQAAAVPHVPIGAAQPGDLLFYYSPISHVGIYLGNGQLVHAPNTGSSVKINTVSWGKVTAVGRPG